MTTFNLNMANCFSPFSKKIKSEKVGNGLHYGAIPLPHLRLLAATITLNYVPKYGQIRYLGRIFGHYKYGQVGCP